MSKSAVIISDDLKVQLEAIKKEKELASISAVVRLLLDKCGGKV